jgi:hypothetical protein
MPVFYGKANECNDSGYNSADYPGGGCCRIFSHFLSAISGRMFLFMRNLSGIYHSQRQPAD